LAGDLGHILRQSAVGACVDWEALPLSLEVLAYVEDTGDWAMPLTAGDDYELCFTVSPDKVDAINFPYTKIGAIESMSGLRIRKSGSIQPLEAKGFEHFS
jgi:thiamine-monophosphate kinase